MWLRKIAREQRARKWKSTRKWRKAQREKRELEKRLGLLRKRLKADQCFNVNGIRIDVHVIRNRYRSDPEFHFEFGRKEAKDRSLGRDFGERDLDALITAVQLAKRYRSYFASKNGLRPV